MNLPKRFRAYDLKGTFIKESDDVSDLELSNDFSGLIEDNVGNKYWFKNGKWHNENGPAIEWAFVGKRFYINGDYVNCTTTQQLKLLVDIMKLKGLL